MSLRLRIRQTAPLLADPKENLRRIEAEVREQRPGTLTVYPELSLTGYDLGLRARDLALRAPGPPPLTPGAGAVALGFPEEDDRGLLYNAAGVMDPDGWVHRHRKRYLPTYGMFDEGRAFAPGPQGPRVFHPTPDCPTALLLCEELWHPGLVYLVALQGAALVVVMAAAPGRGRPSDPDEDGPRFGSHRAWRLMARTAALSNGVYVALANRVGSEGGVVFAGGSLVADPWGEVVAEASHEAEDTLEVMVDPALVRAARRPFAHLRDEDPGFMARELARLLRVRHEGPEPDPGQAGGDVHEPGGPDDGD